MDVYVNDWHCLIAVTIVSQKTLALVLDLIDRILVLQSYVIFINRDPYELYEHASPAHLHHEKGYMVGGKTKPYPYMKSLEKILKLEQAKKKKYI